MRTPILGSIRTAVTASANRYAAIFGDVDAALTEASYHKWVAPCAGKLFGLRINTGNGPGGALTRTHAIVLNGTEQSLAVVLTGSATTGVDTTNSVTVAAGDTVTLVTYGSAATASTGTIRWGLLFQSSTPGQSLVASASDSNTVSASATRYLPVMGQNTPDATAVNVRQVVATGGTFRNGRVLLSGAPGAASSGKSYAFTLVKNGTDTGITFTVTDTATTASVTANVAVVAGDLLYWKVVPTGTPTVRTVSLSMEFDPTISGESLFGMGTNSAPSVTSGTHNYIIPNGTTAGFSTAESARQSVVPYAAKVQKTWGVVGTAPGASNWWQVVLSIDTVNTAAWTLGNDQIVNGTATASTAIQSNVRAVAAGSTLAWDFYPVQFGSAIPAPGTVALGGVFYIAEPSSPAKGSTVAAFAAPGTRGGGIRIVPRTSAAMASAKWRAAAVALVTPGVTDVSATAKASAVGRASSITVIKSVTATARWSTRARALIAPFLQVSPMTFAAVETGVPNAYMPVAPVAPNRVNRTEDWDMTGGDLGFAWDDRAGGVLVAFGDSYGTDQKFPFGAVYSYPVAHSGIIAATSAGLDVTTLNGSQQIDSQASLLAFDAGSVAAPGVVSVQTGNAPGGWAAFTYTSRDITSFYGCKWLTGSGVLATGMAFRDDDPRASGEKRGNLIARSTDPELAHGYTIDDFRPSTGHVAKQPLTFTVGTYTKDNAYPAADTPIALTSIDVSGWYMTLVTATAHGITRPAGHPNPVGPAIQISGVTSLTTTMLTAVANVTSLPSTLVLASTGLDASGKIAVANGSSLGCIVQYTSKTGTSSASNTCSTVVADVTSLPSTLTLATSATGFDTSGRVSIVTSTGIAVVAYTARSGSNLTGCTLVSGTGAIAAGALTNQVTTLSGCTLVSGSGAFTVGQSVVQGVDIVSGDDWQIWDIPSTTSIRCLRLGAADKAGRSSVGTIKVPHFTNTADPTLAETLSVVPTGGIAVPGNGLRTATTCTTAVANVASLPSTITLASATGLLTSGTVDITTSTGTARISYTSRTGAVLNGIELISGSGAISSGAAAVQGSTLRQYLYTQQVTWWGVGATYLSGVYLWYSDDLGFTWNRLAVNWANNSTFTSPIQSFNPDLGPDGYIYLLATAIADPPSVARVLPANIETKSLYEYWNGTGWTVNDPTACAPVWNDVNDFSPNLHYLPGLAVWVTIFLDSNLNFSMRTASRPEGPWSTSQTILNPYTYWTFPAPTGLEYYLTAYGGYIHPFSTKTPNDPAKLYFHVTLANPYVTMLGSATLGPVLVTAAAVGAPKASVPTSTRIVPVTAAAKGSGRDQAVASRVVSGIASSAAASPRAVAFTAAPIVATGPVRAVASPKAAASGFRILAVAARALGAPVGAAPLIVRIAPVSVRAVASPKAAASGFRILAVAASGLGSPVGRAACSRIAVLPGTIGRASPLGAGLGSLIVNGGSGRFSAMGVGRSGAGLVRPVSGGRGCSMLVGRSRADRLVVQPHGRPITGSSTRAGLVAALGHPARHLEQRKRLG